MLYDKEMLRLNDTEVWVHDNTRAAPMRKSYYLNADDAMRFMREYDCRTDSYPSVCVTFADQTVFIHGQSRRNEERFGYSFVEKLVSDINEGRQPAGDWRFWLQGHARNAQADLVPAYLVVEYDPLG